MFFLLAAIAVTITTIVLFDSLSGEKAPMPQSNEPQQDGRNDDERQKRGRSQERSRGISGMQPIPTPVKKASAKNQASSISPRGPTKTLNQSVSNRVGR